MVFSSGLFLLYFFPVFLLLYFLADKKYKNIFTLLASLFFYAWGAPDFVFIVAGSILIDFFLVRFIPESTPARKKLLLGISIAMNVGLLLYFKYANFFVENVELLLGIEDSSWTKIALPIGISFFTFQKITYSVDIYRGVHKPLNRIWDYTLYILMFPQLIAGPIVRFNEIADQLVDREKQETAENWFLGLFRFSIGLAKKVLVANVLGAQADEIFALQGAELSTATAWIGIVAYSFQIYFDFSGYSDMAIGIGRMIGFKFPENFNNPYISQNITEFWRRWHITLGRWMKDYLYIPLGGSKVSQGRMYFNLWIVFLISGLWHGASWNFVLWGAFHGFFLILDKLFLIKILSKAGKLFSIVFTYLVTLVGWVLFKADDMSLSAYAYLKKMFSFDNTNFNIEYDKQFIVLLIIAAILSFAAYTDKIKNLQDYLFLKEHNRKEALLL
ncbi:MAG: MBOAT family protein, partial [Marinilabiliales bacterium]